MAKDRQKELKNYKFYIYFCWSLGACPLPLRQGTRTGGRQGCRKDMRHGVRDRKGKEEPNSLTSSYTLGLEPEDGTEGEYQPINQELYCILWCLRD